MVFALALPDLLSRTLNHISVLASLASVAAYLQQQLPVVPLLSYGPTRHTEIKTKMPKWVGLLQMFLLGWGLCLLSVYCEALNYTRTSLLGCKGVAHPWFSTRYPCSAFEFNCYERKVQSPTGANLAVLDPTTLLFLSFMYCSGVIVPTQIQDFPFLLGFHVHNCTIADWSAASAISATKHTRMTAVAVTRCNMSSFPDGLTQSLPARLYAMVFAVTNITHLPANVTEQWSPISEFVFENLALEELPKAIFQLNAVAFSFAGNSIRQLPSFDLVHRVITVLDLSSNPLEELPATVGTGTFIQSLNIQDSSISVFPNWSASSLEYATANGSPYCSGGDGAQQPVATISCVRVAVRAVNITMIDEAMPLEEK